MPLNPTQPSLNLACAHQHQPRLCKSHVEIFLILIIRSYIVYFFIGFILEGDGLSSWGEPPESPACCTDTVFMSSVCISPAWCSAVRCTVFKCITLCFKVPFHNLWTPPSSTDSAGVSICCICLVLLRINTGKWTVCLSLFSFHLPHAALWCTIIKQPSPPFNISEMPPYLWMTYRDMEIQSVCVYT